MAMLARPCFDYVALGHVHRHQILCEQPLMVYPGSIERVDFSEEQEDKGYMLVHLERGQIAAEFCSLPVRPFKTIKVDLTQTKEPQTKLLEAIGKNAIDAAVVRCLYLLRPDQVEQIDQGAIATALAAAHSYSLQPDISVETSRSRIPELGTDNGLDPIAALATYVQNRPDLKDISEAMLSAATALMAQEPGQIDKVDWPMDQDWSGHPLAMEEEDKAQQLRLL
jgi:exonuclease SbcD